MPQPKALVYPGKSRRQVLAVLAGGGLGALLGWPVEDENLAASRRKKHCPKGKKHFGKYCISNLLCCTDADCLPCQSCNPTLSQCDSLEPLCRPCDTIICDPANTLVCKKPDVCWPGDKPTDCGGVCKDTKTDSDNCGVCGNVCKDGRVCTAGHCECPPDRRCCFYGSGASFVSLCCPSQQSCGDGVCIPWACNSGDILCGGGCCKPGDPCSFSPECQLGGHCP